MEQRSDIQRLVASAALYALAGFAQRGAGLLLIPIYTRVIDPHDYGILEILNAFSSVLFTCLLIGLASAVNKCYHRDCDNDADREGVVATALLLDLPALILGAGALVLLADPVSRLLVGTSDARDLIPLVAASGVFFALTSLALAGLRAQERALSFSLLMLLQFCFGLGLNIVLVVGYEMGIRGVLWAGLIANAVCAPVALGVVSWKGRPRFVPRLAAPLLRFGAFLVPVVIAIWVMDMSDRYMLRLFRGLDEVALYGVGYKFGMLLQLLIVWPFQLAWPAFAFAISDRDDHRRTYAQTFTYLSAALVLGTLMLSLLARRVLPIVVGEEYRSAFAVVPLVALAYAFNGVYYCVAPGLHLTGNVRYQSVFAVAAAALNVALNLLLIPPYGMMGAALATTLAFLFLAIASLIKSQRVYPIEYEYRRLPRLLGAGALVYAIAMPLPASSVMAAVALHGVLPLILFPVSLLALGFFAEGERAVLRQLVRRTGLTILAELGSPRRGGA